MAPASARWDLARHRRAARDAMHLPTSITAACAACRAPIDGPRLADHDTGDAFHPACAVRLMPEDAVVALIAAAALVLAPAIVVWAG
jgi:hypothetical protein